MDCSAWGLTVGILSSSWNASVTFATPKFTLFVTLVVTPFMIILKIIFILRAGGYSGLQCLGADSWYIVLILEGLSVTFASPKQTLLLFKCTSAFRSIYSVVVDI